MGVQVGIGARNHTHEVVVRHGTYQVIIGGTHPNMMK